MPLGVTIWVPLPALIEGKALNLLHRNNPKSLTTEPIPGYNLLESPDYGFLRNQV